MSIEIGDKLTCKEDYVWSHQRGVMFTKGKVYTLYASYSDIFNQDCYSFIANDGRDFSFVDERTIFKIFDSVKFLRKKKLDKINKINI